MSLPSLNGAKNIPHHGAHVYESRQVTGPGLYETPVTGTLRSNPVTDQAGDAQWSHYSPTGTGSDQRALGLLSLQLTQRDSAHLRFWTPHPSATDRPLGRLCGRKGSQAMLLGLSVVSTQFLDDYGVSYMM